MQLLALIYSARSVLCVSLFSFHCWGVDVVGGPSGIKQDQLCIARCDSFNKMCQENDNNKHGSLEYTLN